MPNQTFVHARDLARGDHLRPDGIVQRVRSGANGCVFVEVAYSNGSVKGVQWKQDEWIEIVGKE